MTIIIHVNQHVIKQNNKTGERKPVLTAKSFKGSIRGKAVENTYSHEAILRDKHGEEVARVIYSPDKPLSCGAKVWIETSHPVECLTHTSDGPISYILNEQD